MANRATYVKVTWEESGRKPLNSASSRQDTRSVFFMKASEGRVGILWHTVSEGPVHQAKEGGRGFNHAKSTDQEPSGQ